MSVSAAEEVESGWGGMGEGGQKLWVQGQTTKLTQTLRQTVSQYWGRGVFRPCGLGFAADCCGVIIITFLYDYIIFLVNVQLFTQDCDHMYWRTAIHVSNCNYLVLRIYFSNGCFRLIFKLFTSYNEKIKKRWKYNNKLKRTHKRTKCHIFVAFVEGIVVVEHSTASEQWIQH